MEHEPYKEFVINSYKEFDQRYSTILKNRHHQETIYRGQSDSDWIKSKKFF